MKALMPMARARFHGRVSDGPGSVDRVAVRRRGLGGSRRWSSGAAAGPWLDRRRGGTSRVRAGHHRCIGRIRRRGPNAGGRAPARPSRRSTRPRWPRNGSSRASIRGVVGTRARRRGSRRRGWAGGSHRRRRRRRRRRPGRARSRRSTARCLAPATASPPARRGGVRDPLPQAAGDAGHLGEGAGPLGLDPERVEPPRRAAGEALGAGRQQQPEVGARRRLAELVAQPGPLAHGLAGRDPLGQDRRQQGVVEVAAGAGADAGEAAGSVGEQGMVIGEAAPAGGRCRSSPAPTGGRGRRPGPQASMRSGPDQSTTTVAGPSGVQQALLIDVGSSRVVGSSRPWRYHDRVRRRSTGSRRRGGGGSADGGGHRGGTYQQHPRAPRTAPPFGSDADDADRSRSGDERHRDLAAQPRRGPDHPQPSRQAQRHDGRAGHRAARRARRRRRRSRRPGRDPHRCRAGVLRRARPRRVRRAARTAPTSDRRSAASPPSG